MKATTFLERQHRRVAQLVTAVERERYVRRALLEDLADDLTATLETKEMIFYPAVREALGGPFDDAEVTVVRTALQRCFDAAADDASFTGALAALADTVAACFRGEERTLFPQVERSFSPHELERLGEQMKQLYREIVEADGDERVSSIGRPSRADWYRFESLPP